jgi:hypothetical protein
MIKAQYFSHDLLYLPRRAGSKKRKGEGYFGLFSTWTGEIDPQISYLDLTMKHNGRFCSVTTGCVNDYPPNRKLVKLSRALGGTLV